MPDCTLREYRSGRLSTGAGVSLRRLVRAERRLYVLSADDGKDAAKRAARAIAQTFQLKMVRGRFVSNNLRLTNQRTKPITEYDMWGMDA